MEQVARAGFEVGAQEAEQQTGGDVAEAVAWSTAAAAGGAITAAVSAANPVAGAVVGAAYAIGMAIARGWAAIGDWLEDAWGEPTQPRVDTLDAGSMRSVPARIGVGGKLITDWSVGPSAMEQRFWGARGADWPAGVTVGRALWLARRIEEDGGGAAEWNTWRRWMGLPPISIVLPTGAKLDRLVADSIRTRFRGVDNATTRAAAKYAVLRENGADAPTARRMVGLPVSPGAGVWLARLRSELEKVKPMIDPSRVLMPTANTSALRAALGQRAPADLSRLEGLDRPGAPPPPSGTTRGVAVEASSDTLFLAAAVVGAILYFRRKRAA